MPRQRTTVMATNDDPFSLDPFATVNNNNNNNNTKGNAMNTAPQSLNIQSASLAAVNFISLSHHKHNIQHKIGATSKWNKTSAFDGKSFAAGTTEISKAKHDIRCRRRFHCCHIYQQSVAYSSASSSASATSADATSTATNANVGTSTGASTIEATRTTKAAVETADGTN
jgi:hypothetical protein